MNDTYKRAKLVEFGNQILYKKSLPEGLPLISSYAKDIIGADRCSMFIYNPQNAELWTTLADGVERIVIPADKGIVGKTLSTKEPIIENNVYSNTVFLVDIDEMTGYRTHNIITAPLFNNNKEIVGVLELLNKDGGFDNDDLKYMKFFSRNLSDFIDLINLYEG
ncbi:MAG: signal transduction protein with GAF and PtsI domain [Sulfurimonas sp.]|jgi:signal transduction protein with GAF and PtsI domain|uniref:GAF domain-containing protein n=1 Tax=Sulfurimonas sp. TaxID=2022749 RepID=UPI0039E50A65